MCTEKDYSGATTSKIGKNAKVNADLSKQEIEIKNRRSKLMQKENSNINKKENNQYDYYKKAGKIAKEAKEYAKQIIKKDMLLVEIAKKIEAKIIELGGEIAFPVNLSIDDISAHYTPTLHDDKKAGGLFKVDLGVHINGFIADCAFSIDLTPTGEHRKIIQAVESALAEAQKTIKKDTTLSKIGKVIYEEITKNGFSPIRNLSGHGLDAYDIHSGITIPNYENGNANILNDGAFAIEPFATTGSGIVYDGAGSNIYHIISMDRQVRDNFSREVYAFILENKKTLPFSQRELEEKFGSRALFAVSNLKRAGIIDEYPQLIEKTHKPVAQAENTLIIDKGKVEVIT